VGRVSEQTLFGGTERYAEISECGRYRYTLGRQWGDGPLVTFVMLNPSTADAEMDDPTIRRCLGFARSWGAGALHVVNLYALRSTDPAALWVVPDPVGPDNDRHLAQHAHLAVRDGAPIVAAWGANARQDRVAAVRALPGMDRLQCLGVTKDGAPRHPLYLPAIAEPRPWPVVA
jgi:hypothetical protein